jgi:hypothetical protein
MADQQSNGGTVIGRPNAPPAIAPVYTTAEPNAPVLLYDGPLELVQGPQHVRGHGTIRYEWSPTPRPRFGFSADVPLSGIDVGAAACLLISGRVSGITCRITSAKVFSDGARDVEAVRGQIHESLGPTDSGLKSVLFHVANFRDLLGRSESVIRYESGTCRAGRLVLQGGGWTVTVDALENDRPLRNALRDQSGYAITHAGRIERSDGAEFSAAAGAKLLEALWWFFSFAEGRWTGPVLPIGVDAQGRRIWEEWRGLKVAPWRFVLSWLDDHYPAGLTELFSNFLDMWQDPDGHQPLRFAIHWYVEANNQAGAVEGGTVLTQTAFELLAWSVIVAKEGRISAGSFDRLPAADKLRLLLSWANLPLAIPGTAIELAALAARKHWSDAAQALTSIRNSITHPSPQNRERFSDYPTAAVTEAWNLGLWYLERLILRLLEYRGPVGNRLKRRWVGEVESVPWDTSAAPIIPTFDDSEDDTETDAEVLQQLRAMG